MFTEQPAPPQPAAHIQVQPAAIAAPQAAPSPAPIERGVAAPESACETSLQCSPRRSSQHNSGI
ncbi:hypothetical protein [Leptodesmis sp.]|uniref:hypothetical protein n=1 Tax=Leptodesmis sp. TaxID=3100501 RepID=UPI00405353DB